MHKQPRVELSEQELRGALEECAREPIHIPGSIQPHGFLVVFNPRTGVIGNCSENVLAFLARAPDEVLGKTLADVFGHANAAIMLSA
ncbi:MAG: hypothetical protein SV422_10335, partial [Pseudomonadota bacterium]|nr:hypothetical protein [Pseudomonadota bacterium]